MSDKSSSADESESGKKSDKKLEFVDFKKLTGQDKLKALKDRGYCPNCMKKKHEGSEECEAKGHVCKKCDKNNHFEKCCAFPKLSQDWIDKNQSDYVHFSYRKGIEKKCKK